MFQLPYDNDDQDKPVLPESIGDKLSNTLSTGVLISIAGSFVVENAIVFAFTAESLLREGTVPAQNIWMNSMPMAAGLGLGLGLGAAAKVMTRDWLEHKQSPHATRMSNLAAFAVFHAGVGIGFYHSDNLLSSNVKDEPLVQEQNIRTVPTFERNMDDVVAATPNTIAWPGFLPQQKLAL